MLHIIWVYVRKSFLQFTFNVSINMLKQFTRIKLFSNVNLLTKFEHCFSSLHLTNWLTPFSPPLATVFMNGPLWALKDFWNKKFGSCASNLVTCKQQQASPWDAWPGLTSSCPSCSWGKNAWSFPTCGDQIDQTWQKNKQLSY